MDVPVIALSEHVVVPLASVGVMYWYEIVIGELPTVVQVSERTPVLGAPLQLSGGVNVPAANWSYGAVDNVDSASAAAVSPARTALAADVAPRLRATAKETKKAMKRNKVNDTASSIVENPRLFCGSCVPRAVTRRQYLVCNLFIMSKHS